MLPTAATRPRPGTTASPPTTRRVIESASTAESVVHAAPLGTRRYTRLVTPPLAHSVSPARARPSQAARSGTSHVTAADSGAIPISPFAAKPLLVTASEPSPRTTRFKGRVPTTTWRPVGWMRHPEGSRMSPPASAPGTRRRAANAAARVSGTSSHRDLRMGPISPGARSRGRATLLADERPRLPPDRPHALGPRVVPPARGAARAARSGAGRPRGEAHGGPCLPHLPARRPDDSHRGLRAVPARPGGRREGPGEDQPAAGRALVRPGGRADAVGRVAGAQPALRRGRRRALGRALRGPVLAGRVRAPRRLADAGAGVRPAHGGAGAGAGPLSLARARRPGSRRLASAARRLRNWRRAPGRCGTSRRSVAAGARHPGRPRGVETRAGVRGR